VLVLAALVAPNRLGNLTPAAFVRIPVEALLGVALLLVLPSRARRVVAALVGVTLGLLAIAKLFDMGFYSVLARRFDPVLDWTMVRPAVEFLTESVGLVGAIGAIVAAAFLVVVLPLVMALAMLRLTRVVVRHRTAATRAGVVLAAAWVACAVLGAQLVPGVPVAAHDYDRVVPVRDSLLDQRAFAGEAAVDAFRDTPGDQLLTALRGKDVIVAFVESYGRDAIEDPEFAPQVGAVLAEGNRRLTAAGYASRSAFLTSPTTGGNSWLAHATLLSGLWINNQGRYRTVMSSDRLTLNGAFRRANWRTVGVMPGIVRDWPEGAFYGYDRIYANKDLGYGGPRYSLGMMPDQYTLSAFQRLERAPAHAPIMAEIPLVSSHAPWAPLPRMIDWDDVDDGPAFEAMAEAGGARNDVWRDRASVRAAYRQSIEYSLTSVLSYVQTYGDDDLVVILLGDHQPAPVVTGDGASRDVPITIVARDPAVLDRISGWGWHEGLKPGPGAPVWPMNAFRDRFLTAYGPQTAPTKPQAQPAR
jgi:hypothetical protein